MMTLADKLTVGDDLLIAGPTGYDADATGLANITTEWTTGKPYTQRVTDLAGCVNETMFAAATVTDDGFKDALSGKKGADCFIVSATDLIEDLDSKLSEAKMTV
jgi:hypothetical protein